MKPSPAALEGRLLGGRYRVGRLIGAGGMGAVFAGVQEGLQRRVAIKVLLGPERIADADLWRFRQEALSAAELGHPNIIQVTDFQSPPGEPPFLVMELLEGVSLRGLLTREPILPAARAAFIATQMLAALAAAHRAGIVHRDVKPPNVFLTRTPAMADLVKVLDFGIAKAPHVGPGAFRTGPGAILGTPAYMAPEQASGIAIDHRVDLYATGACLFEMLAGRRVYMAPTAGEVLAQLVSTPAPPLASVTRGLDPRLAAVVDRALARDPSCRFGSAIEMLEALAPWARSDSTVGAIPAMAMAQGLLAPAPTFTSGAPNFPTASAPPPTFTSPPPTFTGPPPAFTGPPPAFTGAPPAFTGAPPAPPRRSSSPWIALGIAVGVALVGVLGFAAFLLKGQLLAHAAPVVSSRARTKPSQPAVAVPPDTRKILARLDRMWMPYGYVAVADLVGDQAEDIAVVKLMSTSEGRYLAVIDGSTFEAAWTASATDGALMGRGRGRSIVVLPKKILAHIASPGRVAFYEGSTGHLLREIAFDDEIRQICRPEGTRDDLWVELDETAFLVSAASGARAPHATAPPGCAKSPPATNGGPVFVGPRAPEQDFELDDDDVDALVDGEIAVAVQSASRRSFVGFVRSTRAVLWSMPAKVGEGEREVLELQGGRAYLGRTFSDNAGQLECVNAKTGDRVWSATFTTELWGANLTVSGRRLYLARGGNIYVMDARDGSIIHDIDGSK